MRSVSIGIPAASSSSRCDCGDKRAGFTLIEAADIDEALKIAAKFPAAFLGGMEVRPVLEPGEHAADPLDRKILAGIDKTDSANNPFAAKMQRSLRTRAVARGLAPTEPTDNVLVAYSAKDGTTASDGDGRNSPFTTALLRNIMIDMSTSSTVIAPTAPVVSFTKRDDLFAFAHRPHANDRRPFVGSQLRHFG